MAEFLEELHEAAIAREKEMLQGLDPNTFSLSFRGNELAGETGEACNILKKLDREKLGVVGSRATVPQLMEELSDIIICVDLVLISMNIDPRDFIQAIRDKFNKTSQQRQLETML